MKKEIISRTWKGALALVLFALIGLNTAMAQGTVKMSGRVIDGAGQPLIGVGVVQKGTNNGVSTDLDGKYVIKAPAGSVIVFSYVGFVTEEHAVIEGNYDLSMKPDTKALEEVVVIGYGVQKKSSVTGAISQVKSSDIENRTISSPLQALAGKTSGVQVYTSSAAPGSSPTINIRGISSNYSSTPLYVVDGRIASSISGIDPNDIESMEILKDAASAAIYGVAAGNGVVLISTKHGKIGSGFITYDFQLVSQQIARIPKVLNSEQYVDYMTEANYISMDKIYRNWDFTTNTDWSKVAFETSMMQKHNLAFQGGNQNGSYYLSLTYLDNNGYVVGDADVYKRLTATVNANYNIKPWLEVGTNNQIEYYTRRAVTEGSEYGSLLMSVLQLDPLTKPYYSADELPDNMKYALASGHTLLKGADGRYYGLSSFQESDQYNPLVMRDKTNSISKGFNVSGNIFANIKPFKHFVVTSRLSYNLSGSSSYTVNNDFYANQTVYQDYMSVSATTSVPTYLQWENFANYDNTWGKHHLNAMFGTSFIQSNSFYVSGSETGGLNSDGTVDFGFKEDNPLFAYFAYATATATKGVSGGEETFSRKLAYFGRLIYDYDNKYMAQVSLRADAADLSILPSKERWGYFPAVSLGWVVSQEDFMEKTRDWMSHLKIRASWGQNGTTSALGGYLWNSTVSLGASYPYSNDLNYNTGAYPSTLGNSELRWETSEQLDFGLDARFLRDRLSFSYDFYNKTTKDLIMTGVTLSEIVGNTASPINSGNVLNRGHEFELGWRDNIGDFRYSINGNLATLFNQVTYIPESIERINGASFHTTTGITVFEKGYPAWYFRGYHFLNVDPETGNPVFEDLNSDGIINDSDRTNMGSGLPKFTYGLTVNLAYKGFDFILFGAGSQGNKIFSCTTRGDRLQSNRLRIFYDDRWTASNTDGTVPRAGATDIEKYWLSSAMVFDGSYFKIKQMQLGYTLPQTLLKKVGLMNTRFYVSMDDWFCLTKYPGFDPEVVGAGSATGVDKGYYPSSKKVVFGVNLTF